MSEDSDFIFDNLPTTKRSLGDRIKDLRDKAVKNFKSAREQRAELKAIYNKELQSQQKKIAKEKAKAKIAATIERNKEIAEKGYIAANLNRAGRFTSNVRSSVREIVGAPQKMNKSKKKKLNNQPPMFR